MTVSNFELFIEPRILELGREYFLSNAVVGLRSYNGQFFEAKVWGREPYRVMLELDGDRIARSNCSCPFERGKFCKHQVALFYHLRERLFARGAMPAEESDLRRFIHELGEEELRELVLRLANTHAEVRRFLQGEFALRPKIGFLP